MDLRIVEEGECPVNPIALARLQVIRTAFQMRELGVQLMAAQDSMDMRTQIFIGAAMVTTGQYAFTAMTIITNPDEILPPGGRRCIFY